jgi:hypothetical protein
MSLNIILRREWKYLDQLSLGCYSLNFEDTTAVLTITVNTTSHLKRIFNYCPGIYCGLDSRKNAFIRSPN